MGRCGAQQVGGLQQLSAGLALLKQYCFVCVCFGLCVNLRVASWQDCFWRYVHTKMDERGQTITDPEEWPEMANNLAWEYLRDDAHPELLG